MSKRREARGKPCMVRLPGCSGGGDDTVLAHYRLAGYCGVGIKPPDEMGAWSCHICHDLVDGRKPCMELGFTREEIRLAHAEAVMRTNVERRLRETA